MIAKKDIDNVRSIMEKTKNAASEHERQRYEGLIKSFNSVAERYLDEVHNNARLQHSY